MARRSFLRQMIALPLVGMTSWGQETTHKSLNVMMKSAWGSDDPTKAAFTFLHGLALSEAGHSVQIFLLGEAVSLMRKSVAAAVVPVGWPPLEETLTKVVGRHVQIYACGACSRVSARWPKATWINGVRSSATRPFSYLSWNGPTGSSPSSFIHHSNETHRPKPAFVVADADHLFGNYYLIDSPRIV